MIIDSKEFKTERGMVLCRNVKPNGEIVTNWKVICMIQQNETTGTFGIEAGTSHRFNHEQMLYILHQMESML